MHVDYLNMTENWIKSYRTCIWILWTLNWKKFRWLYPIGEGLSWHVLNRKFCKQGNGFLYLSSLPTYKVFSLNEYMLANISSMKYNASTSMRHHSRFDEIRITSLTQNIFFLLFYAILGRLTLCHSAKVGFLGPFLKCDLFTAAPVITRDFHNTETDDPSDDTALTGVN